MVFGLRPLCIKQVFPYSLYKIWIKFNTELKDSHKNDYIKQNLKITWIFRQQHVHLLLKFLAQFYLNWTYWNGARQFIEIFENLLWEHKQQCEKKD